MASESQILIEILAETKQAREAVDRFSKSAQQSASGVERAFGGIKVAAAAAVGFLAGRQILNAFNAITEAASESQDAANRLATALKLTGDFSSDAVTQFQALAAEIQNTTEFEDDLVISQIALAKSFNLTNAQAGQLVTAAADLAAQKKIGLEEAVRSLGQTFDGTAGRLNELVPGIRGLSEEQLKAGAAVDLVASKFKGAAAASANTYTGAITQTKNAFGDLLETLGGFIIENEFVIKGIQQFKGALVDINSNVNGSASAIRAFIKELVVGFLQGVQFAIAATQALDSAVSKIVNSFLALGRLVGNLPNIGAAAAKSIASLSLGPIRQLNKSLNASSDEDSKGLTERLKGYDQLGTAIAEYTQAIEKASTAQVKATERAVSGTRDQIKGQKELAEERRKAEEAAKRALEAARRDTSRTRALSTDPFSANPLDDEFLNGPAIGQGKNDKLAIGAFGVKSVLGGSEGASSLVSAAAGAVGNALVPGLGPVIGQIVGELAKGPEYVKAQITAFIEALPDIIVNIVESIPVLIETLVEKIPELVERLATGLAEAMPQVAAKLAAQAPLIGLKIAIGLIQNIPQIVATFAREFLKIPGQFAKELIKSIGGLFKGVGKIGKAFGFAKGGIVPQGFPNDRFPANLSSGEYVIPPGPTAQLTEFLNNQSRGGGSGVSDERVRRLESKLDDFAQNLSVSFNIGAQELARSLLEIRRRGFRTA